MPLVSGWPTGRSLLLPWHLLLGELSLGKLLLLLSLLLLVLSVDITTLRPSCNGCHFVSDSTQENGCRADGLREARARHWGKAD